MMLMKMEKWKKVVCVVASLVVVVAMVGLRDTHTKLTVVEQTWQAQDPRASSLWRLRMDLSSYHWLWVMRPDPPNDPYIACNVKELPQNLFSFMSRLFVATDRLDCLQHEMNAALAQHNHFRKWIFITCAVLLIVVVAVIRVVVASVLFQDTTTSINAEEKSCPFLDDTKTRKQQPPQQPHKEQKMISMNAEDRRWRRLFNFHRDSPWTKQPPPQRDSKERLEEALDAAMQRQRKVVEGRRVPCDSLDWWRCSSGTKEKLVVPLPEHFNKNFHRYRYLRSSRKPPQPPPPAKPLVQEQRMEDYLLLVSRLSPLLEVVNLMLLIALVLRR